MQDQIVCKNCGTIVPHNLFYSQTSVAKTMRTKSLCFECVFWESYKESPTPGTYIVSGKLYEFHPVEDILENGSSRRAKNLSFAQDMQTMIPVYARNCRCIATVPERYKSDFPDRYRFISERTYTLLINRGYKECRAKGCWDRYQCFWYNKEEAEPKAPWNTIPHYHKLGDENCESFINKETMYINKE